MIINILICPSCSVWFGYCHLFLYVCLFWLSFRCSYLFKDFLNIFVIVVVGFLLLLLLFWGGDFQVVQPCRATNLNEGLKQLSCLFYLYCDGCEEEESQKLFDVVVVLNA